MDNMIVTVARGFGTGGKMIASMVAAELGVHCYENRILTLASQLSGYDEKKFEEIDEKLRNGGATLLLQKIPRLLQPRPVSGVFCSDDKLFAYQKKIIEDLAKEESCVIVGKCADHILMDYPNVVSVYIEAPREYCRDRVMNRMMVSEPVADKLIKDTDKYRAQYYKYYSGGNYWTNPVNYDLTLNPARIGQENCVRLILDAVKYKRESLNSK